MRFIIKYFILHKVILTVADLAITTETRVALTDVDVSIVSIGDTVCISITDRRVSLAIVT